MQFCRTSLVTLKKLIRAMSDNDVAFAEDLQRKMTADAGISGLPVSASSTSMALMQLGLIDGRETSSDLSV